jgi:hypothetical protein
MLDNQNVSKQRSGLPKERAANWVHGSLGINGKKSVGVAVCTVDVVAKGVCCLLGLVLVGEGSHDAESMKSIPTCCFVSLKSMHVCTQS